MESRNDETERRIDQTTDRTGEAPRDQRQRRRLLEGRVMTEWRAIPGYEGRYEVSDDGQVRSLDQTICQRGRGGTLITRHYRGRVRKGRIDTKGYPSVRFDKKNWSIHCLMAAAFIGPRPPGHHVRHLDGNPLNRALSNIAYGTPAENVADKTVHGTMARGDDHGRSKLTEANVRVIRALLLATQTRRAIAARFGVSRTAIDDVWSGRTWGHVR